MAYLLTEFYNQPGVGESSQNNQNNAKRFTKVDEIDRISELRR
jgi:hypothetical protein